MLESHLSRPLSHPEACLTLPLLLFAAALRCRRKEEPCDSEEEEETDVEDIREALPSLLFQGRGRP